MGRFILRRLLIFPVAIFLANFGGFAFAYLAAPIQSSANPYSVNGGPVPPLLPVYAEYLKNAARLDFGTINSQPILQAISQTAFNSLGLIVPAIVLSTLIGVALGFRAVRMQPARVSSLLTVAATVGLASPSFFIGVVLISLSIAYVIWGPTQGPLIPFQGFGWDARLVMPTLTLMIQPVVKIAQVTAAMLSTELDKQYVMAALSFGHTIQTVKSRHAFRNILSAVIQTIAGSVRWMVAELIIIERLFNWQGIGKLISTTLIRTSTSPNYLDPPLVAALITVLAIFFLLVDFTAAILVHAVDPRLRLHGGEAK